MISIHRLFFLFLTIVSVSPPSVYAMEATYPQEHLANNNEYVEELENNLTKIIKLEPIERHLKQAIGLAPDEEDKELEELVLRMVNFVLEDDEEDEANQELFEYLVRDLGLDKLH